MTAPTTTTSKYNNDDDITNKLNAALIKDGRKQLLKDIPGRIAYDKKVGPYAPSTRIADARVNTEKLVESALADVKTKTSAPVAEDRAELERQAMAKITAALGW